MLIDAQTNEPVLCTTVRYRVSDWQALEDILADQDDVEWEDENVWLWVESISEEQFRPKMVDEVGQTQNVSAEARGVAQTDRARGSETRQRFWIHGF